MISPQSQFNLRFICQGFGIATTILGFLLLGTSDERAIHAEEPQNKELAVDDPVAETDRPRPQFREPIRNSAIESGYLFLEGEYIAPPYHLEFGNGEVILNGKDISSYFPARQNPPRYPFGGMRNRPWGGDRAWGGNWRDFDESRFSSRMLVDTLEGDGLVILAENDPPITVPSHAALELFAIFVGDADRQANYEHPLVWLPPRVDREQFVQWANDYEVPETLRQRIDARFAENDTIDQQNVAQRDAVLRLDRWSYPLSVLGMVLVVAAFGHLLNRGPQTDASAVNLSPEAIRQANRSLFFVVAMSAMDLAWTILVSQAGAMKELNPLGSKLLHDPVQLTVFKVAFTALAVALIFGLRRYRRAQDVSWWGCLLFTLLTVRWLTLNSLFV